MVLAPGVIAAYRARGVRLMLVDWHKKGSTMDDYTTEALQEACRPIASLISKSEKAQKKLAPGTWQHTMMRDNLEALHIASALMNKDINDTDYFTRDDLQEALQGS